MSSAVSTNVVKGINPGAEESAPDLRAVQRPERVESVLAIVGRCGHASEVRANADPPDRPGGLATLDTPRVSEAPPLHRRHWQRAGIPSRHTATVAPAVLLVALILVAYLPALHAGFIWDDDLHVTANPTLLSVDGLRQIWLQPGVVPQYYPLTFTSFWVEHHLWGPQPMGYHIVNILLHALNALLVWRVLRRLRVPGAWMAAAIFGLHPMHVESVVWITERKNVLSGLLVLGALLLYLRGTAAAGGGPMHRRTSGAVYALFLGALLSKSVTCTLPGVLLLLAWWQHGRLDRRTVRRVAPLFVFALGMALLTVWVERHYVGAEGHEWVLSAVERGLVAGRVLWFYPRTLLWPASLTFIYPRWSVDAHAWWQYLFPAAAGAVLIGLYLTRTRVGKGPVVAALCYTGTLVPALGFFNVYPMRYSFVADHFAYLPSIALIALIAAAGAVALQRAGRVVAGFACASVLVVLGSLTARQCGIYRDLYTLWTDTLAKNPACWLAHTNLAGVLNARGDADGAIAHYQQALQWKPDYVEARLSLGNIFEASEKHMEAVAQYMEVLREPASARVPIERGMALMKQGKTTEAIAQYVEALQVQPDPVTRAGCDECWTWLWAFAGAHNNIGVALAAQGKTEEALAHYNKALQSRPGYPEAHNNLGNALLARGQLAEASAQYALALQRRPAYAEAHNNYGVALARQGRTDAALAQFEQALRWQPDYSEAHGNLGNVLYVQGKLDDSIAQYREALRLNSANQEARRNLELALAAQKQIEAGH